MKATWGAMLLSQRRPISHSCYSIYGNPDTKYIMESVDVTVMKVKTIGQDQYSKFVDEMLPKCVTSVTDPWSKTNYNSSATQQ